MGKYLDHVRKKHATPLENGLTKPTKPHSETVKNHDTPQNPTDKTDETGFCRFCRCYPKGYQENFARQTLHSMDRLPALGVEGLREVMQELYEERAAIMEFDGGLPRPEAERQAWQLVKKAMS